MGKLLTGQAAARCQRQHENWMGNILDKTAYATQDGGTSVVLVINSAFLSGGRNEP